MDVTYVTKPAEGTSEAAVPHPQTEKLTPVSYLDGQKDPSARLVYVDNRQLELRPDPSWNLLDYKLAMKMSDGKIKTQEGKFTQGRYYRVIIPDYTGAVRELFDNLADPAIVNGLEGLRPPKSLWLGVADLVNSSCPDQNIWSENRLTMYVTPPPKCGVTSAWVLFPLTKEDADKEKALLDQGQRQGTITSESAVKDLENGSFGGYDAAKVGGEVTLTAAMKPQWYKIETVAAASTRRFRSSTASSAWQMTRSRSRPGRRTPCATDACRVVLYVADVRDKPTNKLLRSVVQKTKPVGSVQKDQPWYWHVQPVVGWASDNSPFAAKPAQGGDDSK